MAYKLDILGSHQSLVVSLVSYRMGPTGSTGERQEMVLAKGGTHTRVTLQEMDSWVARIVFCCSVYFQHYYLILLHCHLGIVVSQTPRVLEPYWLTWAEVCSLTSYVEA
jgi:hypothetical protein